MLQNVTIKSVVKRLPMYLDYLLDTKEQDSNIKYISSKKISDDLSLGEVQVRKDLSLISGKGKPKIGYDIESLTNTIGMYLGCNQKKNAILIGAGKLGKALLNFEEFNRYGIEIVTGFDLKEFEKTDTIPIRKFNEENLQQIFNLSTVEFQNTTVFSDFEAICANLGKFLGRFTVIVSSDIGGLGYTEIDKILCGYYNTTSNKYNDCVYYMSSAGICVVLPLNTTMQGLSNEFFVDKLHLHPACAFMQLFGLEKIDVKKLFFEIPNSSNFDISIYAKDKICQLSIKVFIFVKNTQGIVVMGKYLNEV